MEPIYQTLALYKEFPSIDIERLANAIQSLEQNSPACETEPFGVQNTGKNRAATGGLLQGDMSMSISVKDEPAPQESQLVTMRTGILSDEDKAGLFEHRSHVVLSVIGGETRKPVDRTIFMLKAGIALCRQNALGIVNAINGTCFPSDYLQRVSENIETPTGNLWNSLRKDGAPAELLVGFKTIKYGEDLWFVSMGHGLYGLPDLARRANDPKEMVEMQDLFHDIFYYLYKNGPVIQPGHTMQFSETRTLRFAAPPPEPDFLMGLKGTLILEDAPR